MASNQQGSGSQRGGSGNFAQDRERASEAGRKGGERGHGQASGHQPASSQPGASQQRGGGSNFAEDRDKASKAGKKGGSH